MQKTLTRIAAAVFVLQASLSYLPYVAQARSVVEAPTQSDLQATAQAVSAEKQAALDCRSAKLDMRKQVDELNRSRTAAWADHWKQFGDLMVSGFSTDDKTAARRLGIVKDMWTQVMLAQKQYIDQAQNGGENVQSPTKQIASILSDGTSNLTKLSTNEKISSWREEFLNLLNDQKSNYFQTIDIIAAYNSQYQSACGAEIMPTKDSTDQDSMNRMANAKVVLTDTPTKDTTPVATKQCSPSQPLVDVYGGNFTRVSRSWESFQSNYSSSIAQYFASPSVQAILTKTHSTPEKLIQSVITAATAAQNAYIKAMTATAASDSSSEAKQTTSPSAPVTKQLAGSPAASKVDTKDLTSIFQNALNAAPQAIVKVLGESVNEEEWFRNFSSLWQETKTTYVSYASSFIDVNKQYGVSNSCIPVTFPADPTNAAVIAIFSSNKLVNKKPGDITPTVDACAPRKALADEFTKVTSSTTSTMSRFMKAFALAGVFNTKSLGERQQLVNNYNDSMREIEASYIRNNPSSENNRKNENTPRPIGTPIPQIEQIVTDKYSSKIIHNYDILGAQKQAQQEAGMDVLDQPQQQQQEQIQPLDQQQNDTIDQTQQDSGAPAISSWANDAVSLYAQLANDMNKYLVDRKAGSPAYTKLITAINNSASDLATARDAYRTTLAKVYAFNQTAKDNKCALIPVNKADPLSQVLVQPFVTSASTTLLQTFGLQSSQSQTDVSQDKAVQMQCFIDSSNLVALQNKALTTSKLRWFDLLSTLLSSTNGVFSKDKESASSRKNVAVGYISYMRSFRDNLLADYAGNEGDTSIIANYGSQMAQGLLGVFGTMDQFVTPESQAQWEQFKSNAEQVAYDTKQDFARVIAAYDDFNAQNAGQCSRLQVPLQDTVDTSFASFFQK